MWLDRFLLFRKVVEERHLHEKLYLESPEHPSTSHGIVSFPALRRLLKWIASSLPTLYKMRNSLRVEEGGSKLALQI